MEFEEQVLQEVWKGAIPIRISLSTYDIASHETPPDYYSLVLRSSYLPQLLESVKAHFEPYTSTDFTLESIWFTFNSVALKWHYPVGFLVDINTPNNLILTLPFHIEAHFHRFPNENLLAYQGLKSLKNIFQNSLKESCALLLGTSGPVMNLSRDQENNMWKAASSGDFRIFKEIGNDFVRIPKNECRFVPVRIFYAKIANGIILQPFGTDDRVKTVIEKVDPGFAGKVIVQGIQISMEAELYWLWKVMASPDNFLYITLID